MTQPPGAGDPGRVRAAATRWFVAALLIGLAGLTSVPIALFVAARTANAAEGTEPLAQLILSIVAMVVGLVGIACAALLLEARRVDHNNRECWLPLFSTRDVLRLFGASTLAALIAWVTVVLVGYTVTPPTEVADRLSATSPALVVSHVSFLTVQDSPGPSAWPATLAFLGVIGGLVTVIIAALVTLRLVLQDDA